jgi:hypothetical protein
MYLLCVLLWRDLGSDDDGCGWKMTSVVVVVTGVAGLDRDSDASISSITDSESRSLPVFPFDVLYSSGVVDTNDSTLLTGRSRPAQFVCIPWGPIVKSNLLIVSYR